MTGEITASIAAPFRKAFHLPPEDNTLTVWPQRFDRRTLGPRPARQRGIPTELARPLSANSVLSARFGVRRRHSAAIGVAIGAIAVLGIALSLASYSKDDAVSPPRLAPAGPSAIAPPQTGALPGDVAPPRTVNLVTTVEIQTHYAPPPPAPAPEPAVAPIAERKTYVSRDRPRVRPVKPAPAPKAEPTENKTDKPARTLEDNPYEKTKPETPSPTLTAQPAVDENPY